jgi:hypothetical protein
MFEHIGHVAELVYAYASGAYGAILGSSNLLVPTAFARRALPAVAEATGYRIVVVYTLRVREAPVRFRVPRPVFNTKLNKNFNILTFLL